MRYRVLHLPTSEGEPNQFLVLDTHEEERYTRCEFIASCPNEWIAREVAAALTKQGVVLDEPF